MNDLFSPLGKENCLVFYLLSVLMFVIFVVAIVSALFMKNGRVNMMMASLSPLVAYYMYRLLYSMCEKSL